MWGFRFIFFMYLPPCCSTICWKDFSLLHILAIVEKTKWFTREGLFLDLLFWSIEIPWTEEPGRLQSIGLKSVRHDWSNLACTHYIYLSTYFGLLKFPCKTFLSFHCLGLIVSTIALFIELKSHLSFTTKMYSKLFEHSSAPRHNLVIPPPLPCWSHISTAISGLLTISKSLFSLNRCWSHLQPPLWNALCTWLSISCNISYYLFWLLLFTP